MQRLNPNPLLSDSTKIASENDEFKLFLSMADKADRLFIDTETNGENIKDGRGHTIGVSIDFSLVKGDDSFSYYFPFRHDQGNLDRSYLSKLKELIEPKPVAFHNAPHDLMTMDSLGIKTNWDFYCTLLLAHRVDENMLSYSLDSLSKNLGYDGKARDDQFKRIINIFGWAGTPPSHMAEYAATDASLCHRLFDHYYPLYENENPLNTELWETEKEFILLKNKMEQRGAKVDLELAEKELDRGQLRMSEIKDELKLDPGSRNELQKLLIDELGLPVLKTSAKTGKPSFDKGVMEQYDEMLQEMNTPVARLILEYRGYQKATSSYWKSYLDKVSPDGRIRPNYKMHGTKTGRLSCEEPNLQQIPRITTNPWNMHVKQGFIAESGYRLWEADYSQLEFRLAAAYMQDHDLIAIFSDDSRDVFTELSDKLNYDRNKVKTMHYAISYGAQLGKIKYILNTNDFTAQTVYDDYFEVYPGVRQLTNMAASLCRQRGYVEYWTTRRRHFYDRRAEAHKAFNSVIQGGAAEIVKRQMIRLDKELDPECRMLLQVHDSVVFEIPEGKEVIYGPQIKKIMEDVQPDFGVKFKVDFHEWGK